MISFLSLSLFFFAIFCWMFKLGRLLGSSIEERRGSPEFALGDCVGATISLLRWGKYWRLEPVKMGFWVSRKLPGFCWLYACVPRAIASSNCCCCMYWLKALGYCPVDMFRVVYFETEVFSLASSNPLGEEDRWGWFLFDIWVDPGNILSCYY